MLKNKKLSILGYFKNSGVLKKICCLKNAKLSILVEFLRTFQVIKFWKAFKFDGVEEQKWPVAKYCDGL